MKLACVLVTAVLGLITATASATTTQSLPAGMTAVPLATITNDRDSNVSEFALMLDDQAFVRGIYMETSAAPGRAPAQKSGQVYWIDGIESPDGVVLGQGQGVKAIFLQGMIQPQGSGSLTIKYLHNGLFKSYRACSIRLQRLAPYDWQLVNAYDGHPIKLIQVQTWALGISTIANVCPGGTSA